MKTEFISPFESIKVAILKTKRLFFVFLSLLLSPLMTMAQIDSARFEFGGKTRDYFVFLPHSYDGITKMPVVFNLHGYTLDKSQQMHYSKMNLVADTAGFIVVYPNAVDATWSSGSSVFKGANDVRFIDALIDTLGRHYSIDREKIYSCGFSNGGIMSSRLASELSNKITAVASVAGSIAQTTVDSWSANHLMPVLIIHGTADDIIPYRGVYDLLSVENTLNHWTRFNHCLQSDQAPMPDVDTADGCTVERVNYKDSTDRTLIRFYKVIGGGHSWPGGDKNYLQLNWANLGATNGDFNASAEIWNFFKSHTLSGLTITGVNTISRRPVEFSLAQNYPNPFNPITKIRFHVTKFGLVTLTIYDVLGKEIATLVNEEKPSGTYEATWNAIDVPSGVYFYQLKSNGMTKTRTMAVVR